ncbi:MAG: FecR domain-containing protein [Odoribacteraceae bacterium]|jgi:ferric-dicitrate binding protein FerR (iron transport regulator)|nr:FecR domain-containing protein [Odoribacteraceae bacterium]
MDHDRLFTISRLILAEIAGNLPERQARELAAWREECPEHEALYRQWQDERYLRDGMKALERVDSERALEAMLLRARRASLRRRRARAIAWASSTAALVALSVGILHFSRPASPPPVIAPVEITPGHPRATLQLADGSLVLLDTLRGSLEQGGVELAKDNPRQLSYLSRVLPTDTLPVINEIRVPRGGEFDLVLSDGTRVWLNADSRLRFPVKFTGAGRRVILEGEAYFEVTSDPSRPFRVEVGGHLVEARGTAFNISGYGDAPATYTTLVNGSVTLSDGRDVVTLEPGEQGVARRVPGEGIEKRRVNAGEIASWREGSFILEERTLEEITREIARWYDVEILFREGAPRSIAFKGRVPRYADLHEVLLTLEKTGEVTFSVEGRTIIVDK